jgi:peptidoglycan/LPS O-acetylase OafA/YrhL
MIEIISFLRGLMALLVVFGHFRNSIFIDYSSVSSPTLPQQAFYAFTSVGDLAVVVFFVISGFLVTRSFLRELSGCSSYLVAFRLYFIKRTTRIFIVFIPVMILSMLMFVSGYVRSDDYIVSASNWGSGVPLQSNQGWGSFIFSLFLIPGVAGFTMWYGLAPGWSLINEYWYYLTLPILFCFLFSYCKWIFGDSIPDLRISKRSNRIFSLVLFPALFFIQYRLNILLDFPLWIVGSILAFYLNRFFSFSDPSALPSSSDSSFHVLVSLLFIPILIILSDASGYLPRILVALLTSIVILIPYLVDRWIAPPLISFVVIIKRPLSFLSHISYSLYLSHWLVIIFLSRLFPGFLSGSVSLGLLSFSGFLSVIAFSLFVAYLVYFLIESHSNRLCAFLARTTF